MHMADALVSPPVAGAMFVLSSAAAIYSVKKVTFEKDPGKVPLMGVMSAFVFAGQMINFTIPGTGSSGHLCGGLMLSALLGPYAGFLSMIGVILIQSLLFADGGLMALGCNIWNMAFYGCFAGTLLIWDPIMKKGLSRPKIILASVTGCVVTLQLGAFSVTLETLLSGISRLPFPVFVMTMQPIHLAIGLVEGLITSAVLCFIYEARPELLRGYAAGSAKTRQVFSLKAVLAVLAVCTAVIGGGLSLYASANPDGLEWSMEKVAGSSELEAEGAAQEAAATLQNGTAILPDYAFKGSESGLGTSVSGLLGSAAVLVLCGGVCYLLTGRRKRNSIRSDN